MTTTNTKDLFNNTTLYSEKLLAARINSTFITIPQTTIDYEHLHKKMTDYDQVKYCITKLEQHEDGGFHIHQVIRFKQQVRIKQLLQKIASCPGTLRGSIDYQTPKKITACIQYLKKELTAIDNKPYLEWGEAPLDRERPKVKSETNRLSDKQRIQNNYAHATELAQAGNPQAAVDYIKTHQSQDFWHKYDKIIEAANTLNKSRKEYSPPDMTKESVNLRPKQQEVWELLQELPKQRRIIWVTGHYGSGKTFLYNYIKENHEYGMYDAGQSASLDNVAYGYDKEGVIAWDLPKTFNFNEKGDSIASVIEKFSDFGHNITSKKYSGKSQKVLGHVIVFSNHDPIEQLKHRDIIHINLSKAPLPIKKEHQFSDSDSTSSTSDSNQSYNSEAEAQIWTNLGKNINESDSDDGNDSDTIQQIWMDKGRDIDDPRLIGKLLRRDHYKNYIINKDNT